MAMYCLFEWSHFLEVTDQLPFGSLSGRSVGLETVGTFRELDKTHTECLIQHYREICEDFSHLWDLYEDEKRRAATRHTLRIFPAMAEWTPKNLILTEAERLLIKESLF